MSQFLQIQYRQRPDLLDAITISTTTARDPNVNTQSSPLSKTILRNPKQHNKGYRDVVQSAMN
jgi:hypothetical protein